MLAQARLRRVHRARLGFARTWRALRQQAPSPVVPAPRAPLRCAPLRWARSGPAPPAVWVPGAWPAVPPAHLPRPAGPACPESGRGAPGACRRSGWHQGRSGRGRHDPPHSGGARAPPPPGSVAAGARSAPCPQAPVPPHARPNPTETPTPRPGRAPDVRGPMRESHRTLQASLAGPGRDARSRHAGLRPRDRPRRDRRPPDPAGGRRRRHPRAGQGRWVNDPMHVVHQILHAGRAWRDGGLRGRPWRRRLPRRPPRHARGPASARVRRSGPAGAPPPRHPRPRGRARAGRRTPRPAPDPRPGRRGRGGRRRRGGGVRAPYATGARESSSSSRS